MNRLNRQRGRNAHSPDYLITVAGLRISPELDARLVSLTLVDKRGFQSDQLDITLANHDGKLALPARGAELSLSIGWKNQALVDRGTFIVDEVEHSGAPDQLIVRARAADMRNALPGKRSQSWHGSSLQNIISSIASRHNLDPRVSADLSSVVIPHIDQTDESDLHFLTRLAERHDANATIKAGHLLFMPQGSGVTVGGSPIPAVTMTRQVGDTHRYVVSDRNTFSGVIAWWHDPVSAQRRFVQVGTDTNAKSLRGNFASEADARSEANSEWRRIRRAGSTLNIELASGMSNLYPETPVIAQGWPVDIDDTPWVVVDVTHSLTDSAYTSSIAMEVLGAEVGEYAEEEFEDL